jgi:hypothetical protein
MEQTLINEPLDYRRNRTMVSIDVFVPSFTKTLLITHDEEQTIQRGDECGNTAF